jgi:hypothetical protein
VYALIHLSYGLEKLQASNSTEKSRTLPASIKKGNFSLALLAFYQVCQFVYRRSLSFFEFIAVMQDAGFFPEA